MRSKIAIATLAAVTLLAGCSDADVASDNLSKDADNFKVPRRITFINGITDRYLLTVEGFCSVAPDGPGGKIDVTCKVPGGFKKDFLGLSDNTTWIMEQLDPRQVSTSHYKVVFKPSVVIPDIEVR